MSLNLKTIDQLPGFSNFLEKLIYNRLQNYLIKKNILTNNQFGFRCKHDMSMAIIEMID